MKLDCSLVDTEYLEKAEIEICDYMDDNDKKLDNYLDYVILTNGTDERIPDVELNSKQYYSRKKKKKIKNKTSLSKNSESTKKIITLDNKHQLHLIASKSDVPGILDESNFNFDDARKAEDRLAVEVLKNIEDDHVINEDTKEDETLIQESTKDIDEEIIEEVVVDTKDVGEDTMDVEMLEETYENYEVMEIDGSEYVMIGDSFYKIERE